MKKSEKKSSVKKIILPEYYDTIDELPIIRWEKIHDTGNMVHLLVKRKELTKKQIEELTKVWNKIYEEYITVFGFAEQFKMIMELKIKIAKLKLKKIITDDESIINFIRNEQRKLKNLTQSTKGGDIYKAKAAIEKKMGIYIPLKEISVREFCSYLKDLK